jgi:hypothetical protein
MLKHILFLDVLVGEHVQCLIVTKCMSLSSVLQRCSSLRQQREITVSLPTYLSALGHLCVKQLRLHLTISTSFRNDNLKKRGYRKKKYFQNSTFFFEITLRMYCRNDRSADGIPTGCFERSNGN